MQITLVDTGRLQDRDSIQDRNGTGKIWANSMCKYVLKELGENVITTHIHWHLHYSALLQALCII